MQKAYSFTELEELVSRMYGGQRVSLQDYWYPVNFATAVGDATINTNLLLNSDADFLCTEIVLGDLAGAISFTSSTIQIEDSASHERWFQTPQQIFNIVSNFVDGSLQFPRWLAATASLDITVAYSSGASTAGAWQLLLHGVNVRRYSTGQ